MKIHHVTISRNALLHSGPRKINNSKLLKMPMMKQDQLSLLLRRIKGKNHIWIMNSTAKVHRSISLH